MIIFMSVRWKNFLSTGNVWTEIQLDKSPNTLIIGENGSGKSTLLDVLCYCLFSKPFRNISKQQLINSVNGRHLEAEVVFKIGTNLYKIVRGHGPRKMEIHLNGTELKQNAAIKDQQEYLEKNILKLNWGSFTQIVILGNASFTPFMQLNAPKRREIIEDLLDIKIFTAMNVLLLEKIRTNKQKLQDVKYKIELEEEKLKLHQDNIKNIKTSNQERLNEINEEIKNSNISISKLDIEINDRIKQIDYLTEKVQDQDKIKSKLNTIKDIEAKYEEKVRKIRKRINFYEENNQCPTCDQSISTEIKTRKVTESTNKIAEIKDAAEKLESELQKYNNRLLDMIEINKQIEQENNQLGDANNQVTSIQSYIRKLNKDIRKESKEGSDLKEENKKVRDISKTLDTFQEKKKKDIFEKDMYDIAYELLRDSGIKTQIIKQYVPIINKLVNKYLASMEFFVQFELNEGFQEVIRSRYRDEFSYASFSEGEKMRIDLALLLTWRAIAKMKNSANTNLLILDEVFDASLDNDGCESFLKLLHDLGNNSNVFVISHKGDILQDKFSSVIKFEKHKNFSRIATI